MFLNPITTLSMRNFVPLNILITRLSCTVLCAMFVHALQIILCELALDLESVHASIPVHSR